MRPSRAISPGTRKAKFDAAAQVFNRATEIGRAAGVTVAVQPSSHHNMPLLTRADYDALFARLDPEPGWVHDTGHIPRGGQVMADTLTAFRDRIRQVRLKDVDAKGDLAMLGAGVR